ncbi:MAG: class I SAM-dependent methyltransferase [Verrucomicrobiota bacterium]
MQTLITPEMQTVKVRQKAMWESGDFGEVAKTIVPVAEEFLGRLPLRPGMRVLDVACGSGNLAMIAARQGCVTKGVDIAANLIAQAQSRAAAERLDIEFIEGDAEALPYADGEFDAVVTMFGAMFAPRPAAVASELFRVTKPGGFVAMANWTPTGFIGAMFDVFKKHLPPPPAGVPSTMLWGQDAAVRERLAAFADVKLERRIAVMRYPFPPAESVDFFRRYYGPTGKAFDALGQEAQTALRHDLVELQTKHNSASDPVTTEAHAEYLEVMARRVATN